MSLPHQNNPSPYSDKAGTVYLLHFSRPYHHARHYIGWTDDLAARLARHRAGNGSRLLRAVLAAGLSFTLARTWTGTKTDERRLHNRKNSARLCPVCRAAREGKTA